MSWTGALKPEDHLARYRILGPLGAGGMGEVYRARDGTLERDVALKILPPALTQSEDRVRRFELEAKSASSLNHPHIVHIYEIGHEPVQDSSQASEPDSSWLHYIAMELVTGTTLASKIHEERADLKKLLVWLSQAAEGVAKAHAAGIVHRDLKPGNIMVSRDGYAKVLDFGLAKLIEGTDGSADATQTEQGTVDGAALGTVGYMAPEQVRGQQVDARADVFAFGCMLYEAATRRRPFAAESQVETLHRILHDAPVPVEQINPSVPVSLRKLIRRCLAKDPNQRLDSMRTLGIELREIVEEFDEPGSGSVTAPVPAMGAQRGAWLAWTLGGVGLIATALTLLLLLEEMTPHLNPNMSTRTLHVPMSAVGASGMSADGRWIALPARDDRDIWGLYYMNTAGGDVRPILVDSTVSIENADISPDGGEIIYNTGRQDGVAEHHEVRIVPTLGGPSRPLAQRESLYPRWRPDGQRVGYIASSFATDDSIEFWSVRPNGSERRQEFADRGWSTLQMGFAWSPDGRRVAWLREFDRGECSEIVVRNLATGQERQITHDHKLIRDIEWTRKGEIVFASNRGGATNLWAISPTGGKPLQITRGPGPDVSVRAAADGKSLSYVAQISSYVVGWWDLVTGEHGIIGREGQSFSWLVRPSPNGKLASVFEVSPDESEVAGTLEIVDRRGKAVQVLAPSSEHAFYSAWSPDGSRICYFTPTAGTQDSSLIHIVDVTNGEITTGAVVPVPMNATAAWVKEDTLSISHHKGSFEYSLSSRQAVNRRSTLISYPAASGWMIEVVRTRDQTLLYAHSRVNGSRRPLMPYSWFCGDRGAYKGFIFCWPESLGLCKLDIASGRLEPLVDVPSEIKRDCIIASSLDGKTIFWSRMHPSSKLVLIENFH